MLLRYTKFFLAFICFGFPVLTTQASHIIGGSLTYEHQGGASYRIVLKLYRDCSTPISPTHANFDANVYINVRDGAGIDINKNFTMPLTDTSFVDPSVDTCAVKPAGVCIKQAIYSVLVNTFTPRVGGYHLYYQRCCRYQAINLPIGNDQGMSLHAFIPDGNVILSNSSPNWINPPPTFVCGQVPMKFNHGATDADGDSLVYKFYTPYLGCTASLPGGAANNCDNAFIPTGYTGGPNINFTPINWNVGYSANNPLGGSNLTLSSTGLLNGTPPTLGLFVVGIKCEEYRNGTKIGEIQRDYQFNVINCPPLAQASFSVSPSCKGQTVAFTNTSNTTGGSGSPSTYDWNFGDPTVITDVSTAQNPTPYTYPGLGPYTAILIINKGTPCADTATQTINVSFVKSNFTSPDSICISDSIKFVNTSSVAANSNISSYQWNFGDPGSGLNNTSAIKDPAHLFSYAGTVNTYTVTLITNSAFGCKDTLKKTITVFGKPLVNAIDTISCANTTAVGITGTALNSIGTLWTVAPAPPSNTPGTFSPNATTLNPTYTPTADEVAQGYATLVLSSSANSKCPVTRDTMKIRFYAGPTANCGPDLKVCKDTTYIKLNGAITVAYGGLWTVINGTTGTISNPASLTNAVYTPSATDIANGVAYIKFETTQNGNCIPADDTLKITFVNLTAIATSTVLSSCVGVPFQITGTSSTNSGLWTSSGDGTFANASQPTTTYTPGIQDATLGYVYLYYNTANNGPCQSVKDSVKVNIISTPIANAGNDTVACKNNTTVVLHGTTQLSSGSLWTTVGTNPGTITNPTSLTTTYIPSATEVTQGFANVVLTGQGLSSCPTKSDTVKISYVDGPTVNIQSVGDSINVCSDTGYVQLTALNTLSTGVQWLTQGTGTFSNATQTTTNYIPSATDVNNGFVWIKVNTTGNGLCLPSKDSLKVKFYGVPTVNATAVNDSVCKFAPISLQGSSSTGSGYWTSNGNGTFSPGNTIANPVYVPGTLDGNPVTLIYHTTNNNGCKSQKDTIKIAVVASPDNNFTTSPACPGQSMQFTNNSTVAAGSINSWSWNFGDGQTSAIQNPTHTYVNSGTYNVTLITTSTYGCTDTLIKPISVNEKPKADFNYPIVCLNQPILFTDASSISSSTINNWQWSFSNGHTSVLQNPTDSFSVQSGIFAQLIVTAANGCKDTVKKTITVFPEPHADFVANDYTASIGQVIQFTDLSTNPVSWSWNFSDNSSNALIQNPTHAYNIAGIYPVTLIITDKNGCVAKVTKEIIIALPPLVPNGFSPNGDGQNDMFYVLGGPFIKCHLKVFNNWGELIFESFEQKNGWDGKRNGVEQPLGVYVWVVDAESENGDTYKKSGDVTLIR